MARVRPTRARALRSAAGRGANHQIKLNESPLITGDDEQGDDEEARSLLPPTHDFVVKDAPLFTGNDVEDRALLHSLIESIFVYPAGFLVLTFKPHAFFAEVATIMFGTAAPTLAVSKARAHGSCQFATRRTAFPSWNESPPTRP